MLKCKPTVRELAPTSPWSEEQRQSRPWKKKEVVFKACTGMIYSGLLRKDAIGKKEVIILSSLLKLWQSTKNYKRAIIGTYNVSQWCNGLHWIYLVPKNKIIKH